MYILAKTLTGTLENGTLFRILARLLQAHATVNKWDIQYPTILRCWQNLVTYQLPIFACLWQFTVRSGMITWISITLKYVPGLRTTYQMKCLCLQCRTQNEKASARILKNADFHFLSSTPCIIQIDVRTGVCQGRRSEDCLMEES